MYKLKIHKYVEKDLLKLDKSVLILFEKKLKQILQGPELGIRLGNKNGLDLTGYNKIYFANKKYRIVYKINNNEICIYLVSVGKREDMDVYKKAFDRK